MKGFRLRGVLFAAFTLIATVPVLYLGIWVARDALQREVSAVEDKHLLIARNVTAALDRYVRDTEAAFQMLTRGAEGALTLSELSPLARAFGYRHFCLIRPDGTVSHSLMLDDVKPAVPRDMVRWGHEVAGPKLKFSDVSADAAGRPTIFLAQRMPDGRLAMGALSTEFVVKLQQAIAFGRKGHAAVVDRSGKLLAHPKPEWQQEMKDISRLPPVKAMMAGKTGVTEFFSPAVKKDMISGYSTVPRTGWGVMVPQPFEELQERAYEHQFISLVLIIIGLATATVIAWMISGLLTRPIRAVMDAARTLGKGGSHARIELPGRMVPRELHELAEGFNSMAKLVDEEKEAMNTALHEARAADIAKSEFLANMSHELRTPLNAIIGFSQVIEKEMLGPLGTERYGAYARDISESGQHLLGIINDILDLSKIESGTMPLEEEPVDIGSVIGGSMRLISERAQKGRISLVQDLPDNLPKVQGNATRFRQILLNLISNAVKFTPEGGSVTVNGRVEKATGDMLIEVADTGIGMTREEVEVALKSFQQVDSALSRRFEGTGLGLPLAKKLVELYDGDLSIESRPGHGTRVTVRMPAARCISGAGEGDAAKLPLTA